MTAASTPDRQGPPCPGSTVATGAAESSKRVQGGGAVSGRGSGNDLRSGVAGVGVQGDEGVTGEHHIPVWQEDGDVSASVTRTIDDDGAAG